MLAMSRVLVRISATATAAMVVWLVGVIVAVLPARDPGSIPLWTVVAVGSAVMVALTFAATGGHARPTSGAIVAFALASAVACATGMALVLADAVRANGHGEGYILAMGLILLVHGGLGLGWVSDVTRRRSA